MKKVIKSVITIMIVLFALIGVAFCGVFVAMKLGWTKDAGLIDTQNDFWEQWKDRSGTVSGGDTGAAPTAPLASWTTSDEWIVLRDAILKDAPIITKAATAANASPRLIVSIIVSEQLRLFTSERDIFKSVFQPLRVLGTQTQFSLGVTGVKEDTAQKIEQYLVDPISPFYLGETYEHLLDYPTTPTGEMRVARFSDQHDHYYSYLYTGIMLRQFMAQWNRSGFSIDSRPEILATLFNLGFHKSIPKIDPKVGGAPIEINGVTYTFGGIAGSFYYSNELLTEFPRN